MTSVELLEFLELYVADEDIIYVQVDGHVFPLTGIDFIDGLPTVTWGASDA